MPFPVTESDSSEERGDSITYQFGLKERISSIDRDQCLVRIETTNSGFPSPSPLRLKRNPILRHSRRWPSGADLGWEAFVRTVTETTVRTLAQNLCVLLAEPGAVVKLAGPRGVGKPLAQVPKDTWLEGVLAAHLSDSRSVAAQTAAMFKPWTWGEVEYADGESACWVSSTHRPQDSAA
eukprot:3938776-Rhodomonas_salina.3